MVEFLIYAALISLALPVISAILAIIYVLGWAIFALGAYLWMKFHEIFIEPTENIKL